MANAPDTGPYVLVFQDTALPYGRTLVGDPGPGINVLDSGPGQQITLKLSGNAKALNAVTGAGLLYLQSNGTIDAAGIELSDTIQVNQDLTDGNYFLEVKPNTTVQKVQTLLNGSLISTRHALNFISGSGVSINIADNANTDTSWITISATANAPTTSKYILQAADGSLTNAQSLGALTTGLVKNTVSGSTGVLSTAVAGTDYQAPSANLTAIAAISPVQGRLLVGSGSTWVGRDVGINGTVLYSNGTDISWQPVGTTVAPANGPYFTFTANASLSAAKNLGLLASGMLKNTVASGSATISKATNGTDYYGPGFAVLVGDGGTGATAANAGFNNLSPMAQNGDLITRASNVATALQIGSAGQVLTVSGGLLPTWVTPTTYAPTNAKYVTLQVESGLSAEFSLGSLSTGLLKNTVIGSVGALTAAVNGTDYYGPGYLVPILYGGTGAASPSAAFDALSPMTAAADIIIGGSSGTGTRLAKGTANQVLAMNSGATAIVWATNTADASGWSAFPATQAVAMAGYKVSGMGDPTLAQDSVTLNYLQTNYNVGSTVTTIAHGGTGQTTANAAFNALSPLTTNGDMIIRAAGVATNLAVGVGGQFLSVVGGLPAWTNFPAVAPVNGPYLTYTSDGFLTNEQNLGALVTGLLLNTVTSGSAAITKATNGTDYYGPGYIVRVADGGTGQTTANAAFAALWEAGGTTAAGDIYYSGSTPFAPTKLAAGSEGQVLTVASGVPSWTIPSGVVPFSVLGSGVTAVAIVAQTGYIANHAATPVIFTLPVSMNAGAVFRVAGFGTGGWEIHQNAGQSIYFGNQITTVGVTGGLSSSYFTDSVEIVCVVANTTYLMLPSGGNINFS